MMSNWRKPAEEDLVATLSRAEVDAFRRSADFEHDPAEMILARTVDAVRGACAQNRNCVMDPTPGTIPPSLMSAAMDIAMFDVLTRINIKVNEDRRLKYENAVKKIDEVASGKVTPEPGAEQSAADAPCAPSISVRPAIL